MPASITLTVAHLPTSTSFFLSCLQPLDYVYRGRVNDTIGFGHPNAPPDFWITQSIPGVPPGPAHVAFPALSRGKVHEFFQIAIKIGARVHGEPALRDECGYYSAAVIDFDGNSIEAVFRPDLLEANKENNIADDKSAMSVTKSVANSKASSKVSSASKVKSVVPSRSGSVAQPASAKSSLSKAPSATPTQTVRSVTPTTVSRYTVKEEPARTTITRAPTAPAATTGSGSSFVDMINEARGTVAFARDMVEQARGFTSPPTSTTTAKGSTGSHGPSDAIVGTLLGVAAGAALHYAYSTRNKFSDTNSAPAPSPETENQYCQEQHRSGVPAQTQIARPYAIEAPLSNVSRSTSGLSDQRFIEMVDHDPSYSEVVSTIKPRRRSSFNGTSTARSSTSRAKSGVRMLEAPPTAYRAPTAITTDTSTRSHHSSRSRANSLRRPTDEGYVSGTSSRQSKSKTSSSRHSSRRNSIVTAIRTPSQTPLPPSRAASNITADDVFYSTHSKAAKTVIGRLTEKQLSRLENGGRFEKGRTEVTRSVIGKVKEVDRLDVSTRELRPQDSVSQVGSASGSERRGRRRT